MIPKNIHLIFLRKEEPFPDLFQKCLRQIKELHPDWNIRLYHEEDALEVLEKYAPQWLTLYTSFQYNVQKADFLRVVLVYLFGGFYLDLDMHCFNPLDDLAGHVLVLGEEKTISEEKKVRLNLFHRLRVANYMFGGVAGHPFWLELIKQMIERISHPVVTQNDILETTGPGLLTNVYHECKTTFPEITLLRNTDRRCARRNHNEIACYFGNFAAHLHSGTWRKEVGSVDTPCAGEFSSLIENLSCEEVREYKPMTFCMEPPEEDSFLKSWPNLNALYELFRDVSVADSDKEPVAAKKRICFDKIKSVSPSVRKEDRLLFVAAHNCESVIRNIDLVNDCFERCIVLDDGMAEQLKNQGISAPLHLLSPGFKQVKRLFNEQIQRLSSFAVGFSLFGNEDDLNEMIHTFSSIRKKGIPDMSVTVLHRYQTEEELFQHLPIQSSLPEWVHFRSIQGNVSQWLHQLDCYLSFSLKDMNELGPMVSLSLGIPTVVIGDSKLPAYDFLNYCFVKRMEPGEAIEAFYKDYSLYEELAIEGAKWIETKYPNEKMKVDILNLLNQ